MEIIIRSDDGRELKFNKASGFGDFSDTILMDRLLTNQNLIQERLDDPNNLLNFLNKITANNEDDSENSQIEKAQEKK